MRDDSWHDAVAKRVILMQIVVGVMATGILFFLAIALIVRPPTKLFPIGAPGMITLAAAVLAGLLLILRPLVLRILVSKARRKILEGQFRAPALRPGESPGPNSGTNAALPAGDAGSLMAVFQSKTIVGAAMLEGGAFFAAITYLVEGGPIGLALAVVLWLGIAAHFPTSSRVIGWIERQLELLDRERLLDQRS